MAGQTNTDKILELFTISAASSARLDALEKQFDQLENAFSEAVRSTYELDKRISLATLEIERLNKRHEETRSHRWEIWKSIALLFVVSALTLASGAVIRWLDRL